MSAEKKLKRNWQDIAAEIACKDHTFEITPLIDELLHSLDEARSKALTACEGKKNIP